MLWPGNFSLFCISYKPYIDGVMPLKARRSANYKTSYIKWTNVDDDLMIWQVFTKITTMETKFEIFSSTRLQLGVKSTAGTGTRTKIPDYITKTKMKLTTKTSITWHSICSALHNNTSTHTPHLQTDGWWTASKKCEILWNANAEMCCNLPKVAVPLYTIKMIMIAE